MNRPLTTPHRPRVLLLLGLAVAVLLLGLAAPHHANATAATVASPEAHAAEASASSGGDTQLARNICAVYNPNGNGYYTYRAMEVLSGSIETQAWENIYCLWVPKVTPNFGSLCGIAQWEYWPDLGPISFRGPFARYTSTGAQHWTCP